MNTIDGRSLSIQSIRRNIIQPLLIQMHCYYLFERELRCVCISFLPSTITTILQSSCILRFSLSLMSPPHTERCKLLLTGLQNLAKHAPTASLTSFISLITRWIQWRILGRNSQSQCSDLLQIQWDESFPGHWNWIQREWEWLLCLNILWPLHWQQRFSKTYLLNWNPSGNLYWIVLYFGCQILF